MSSSSPFPPPIVGPPFVAVIFTSLLSDDTTDYATTADRMEQLAAEQPGYLGITSVRDPATNLGITVSYWRTEADAAAWKRVAEHLAAQQTGRDRWYLHYRVEIATVTRTYGSERSAGTSGDDEKEVRPTVVWRSPGRHRHHN